VGGEAAVADRAASRNHVHQFLVFELAGTGPGEHFLAIDDADFEPEHVDQIEFPAFRETVGPLDRFEADVVGDSAQGLAHADTGATKQQQFRTDLGLLCQHHCTKKRPAEHMTGIVAGWSTTFDTLGAYANHR
jgi:hypothetical protein